jgi:hypothetical protein
MVPRAVLVVTHHLNNEIAMGSRVAGAFLAVRSICWFENHDWPERSPRAGSSGERGRRFATVGPNLWRASHQAGRHSRQRPG